MENQNIRFATFNASLNRDAEGKLIEDLSTPDNKQAQAIAEIIQRNNPDVVLINEFDYDAQGKAAQLFQQNYLEVNQNEVVAEKYPYVYLAPSNTGIPSGFDFDNNGRVEGGNDAYGFGTFPGQFGMVLYSKYPIATDQIRTFQNFLWKDMPGALLPDDANTPTSNDWYSPEELEAFRLSSKSHWDIPLNINGEIVHVLASHPTPPVFDGAEDRNGKRNHDEIRFLADYITPGKNSYIYDDKGNFGGLKAGEKFVIMGDQNADPFDGDSVDNAINQFLDNPLINTSVTPSSQGGIEATARDGGVNNNHQGDPTFDTADFDDRGSGNLRVDYVLPSKNLDATDASVYWPTSEDPLFDRLIGTFDPELVPNGFPSSDHRLVATDFRIPSKANDSNDRTVSKIDFIGQATLPTDLTFNNTEVGGLSGISYDSNTNTYYAISDDRSENNPARFYSLNIGIGDGRLDAGDVNFTDVTTLLNQQGETFTRNGIDAEGIALSSDGTVYISSEGDANNLLNPFVNQFSLGGREFKQLEVPDKFLPTSDLSRGIRNNLAFESLTITPDERFLYTATEEALNQDGSTATLENQSTARILQYDLTAGKPAKEFAYFTDPIPVAPTAPTGSANNGLVDLLAIDNNGTFLALERSFSSGVGNNIRLYEVRTQNATDISQIDRLSQPDGRSPDIKIAEKRLVLDLGELGIKLDNLEGLTFGPTLPDGRQSLTLVSDNNFSENQVTQFLSFAVDIKDVKNSTDQASNILTSDSNELIFDDLDDGTFDLSGSSGGQNIDGSARDDTFFLGRNDLLVGGDGDDRFFVGAGGDNTIAGGNGADQFWIANKQLPEKVNMITDFQAGIDVIGIDSLGIGFDDLKISQNADNIIVGTGDQDLAVLIGIDAANLSMNNFVFA
ncbi:MAG: esterase-like activity of phytase family protein [Waterburya sp.]